MGLFVLKRRSDGWYVQSRERVCGGTKSSFTDKLQNAQTFKTAVSAKKYSCPLSEAAVPAEGELCRPE